MIEPWFRLIPNLWCQIHRWEAWSASVGLLESTSKTQLTATSQPYRDRLGLVATGNRALQLIGAFRALLARGSVSCVVLSHLWLDSSVTHFPVQLEVLGPGANSSEGA